MILSDEAVAGAIWVIAGSSFGVRRFVAERSGLDGWPEKSLGCAHALKRARADHPLPPVALACRMHSEPARPKVHGAPSSSNPRLISKRSGPKELEDTASTLAARGRCPRFARRQTGINRNLYSS